MVQKCSRSINDVVLKRTVYDDLMRMSRKLDGRRLSLLSRPRASPSDNRVERVRDDSMYIILLAVTTVTHRNRWN